MLRWWRSLFGTSAGPTTAVARPPERGDLAFALLGTALRCVAWGVLAGAACGAVAGTVVFPGVGTVAGPVLGAYTGAVAAVPLTPIVLVVLARRGRRPGALDALRTTAAGIVAAVLLGTGGWALSENRDLSALIDVEPWAVAWLGTAVLATTATLIGVLRGAAPSIARGWYRSLGHREVTRRVSAPRRPLEPAR